jgi:hypothetical protein
MAKQKNIDNYLDTMEEAHESSEEMARVDLAFKYANLVQALYRLEKEIREAVDYDLLDQDTHKPVITYEVVDNALELATRVIRYHMSQFEFEIAAENGLEEEP